MNMTSINSNIFSFQSQQLNYQKKTDNKILPKEVAQVSDSKSLEVTASSLSVEKITDYDLENMTPDETYNLAVNLHKSETIPFHDYMTLMAIGLSNQYAQAGRLTDTPNNQPFNLAKELNQIASGTHDRYTFTSESIRTDAEELLELLLSLPAKTEKVKHTLIDIKL